METCISYFGPLISTQFQYLCKYISSTFFCWIYPSQFYIVQRVEITWLVACFKWVKALENCLSHEAKVLYLCLSLVILYVPSVNKSSQIPKNGTPRLDLHSIVVPSTHQNGLSFHRYVEVWCTFRSCRKLIWKRILRPLWQFCNKKFEWWKASNWSFV